MKDHEAIDLIAERLFGWRWMSYVGRPNKGAPDYPREQRVRRFMSPESMANPQWQEYLAKHEAAPATGNEPLEYCYGSSGGWPMPPCSMDRDDVFTKLIPAMERAGYDFDLRYGSSGRYTALFSKNGKAWRKQRKHPAAAAVHAAADALGDDGKPNLDDLEI